jgi:hypothetical protein
VPGTLAHDMAGRRVFVIIAWSAGTDSPNWPVVAGARVGRDSRGGSAAEESTVPNTWNSQSENPYPVARAVPKNLT